MRKRLFSNLAIALVLSVWVVVTPAPVMATPNDVVFDTFGAAPGYIGDISFSGGVAIGTDLRLPGLTLITGGNTFYIDSYDQNIANPYSFSFDTGSGSLSVAYLGGSAMEFPIFISTNPLVPPPTILNGSGLFSINQLTGELIITGSGLDTKDPLFLSTLFGGSFDPATLYQFDFFLDVQSFDVIDPNTGLLVETLWQVSEASITNHVPEPATLLLLVLGLAGCGFFGRRKTKG
jgi:hypothetical protein